MPTTRAAAWRDMFDLDPSYIYLNSGTHSICPRVVLEALTRHQRAYERNPTAGLLHAWSQLWEAQQGLARFLGTDPLDLFFRANVTYAMNAFIMGMPLPRDSEILVSDLEYGAIVNACRQRAARDSLVVREFHIPLEANGSELINTVASTLSPRTSMLVLSHMTSGTGLVFPIEAIARETRRRGVLLAVDGAHGPGAVALDFSQLGDVDFYGGNLHKWMLGPKGTGFGWITRRHRDRLASIEAGWPTFERPTAFGTFGTAAHADPADGQSRFAERMTLLGCHDFAPFFALSELFAMWRDIGAERIRARLSELRACAKAEFAKLGWRCLSPTSDDLGGPMLTYELPEQLQTMADPRLVGAQIMQRLLEAGVQIALPIVQDRWTLRISPHVYNTEDEIRRAAALIASLQ